MSLKAWGREDERPVFQAGELRADGNRAIAEGRGVTVTYKNDPEGMRQDFLVRERPPGPGPLRLWLHPGLDGVVMEVEPDGRGVTFGRAVSGGARVLSYGDLEVRDARGRLLQAKMVRQDEDLFAIVVDDADAAYPILVDPLSSSPDWTAESNQASACFGYSVATAGDVNGDGYSDVIVGAPLYGNPEPYEGRSYVYHGSSTGLAASPAWTAEGDQTSAYFGHSVATAGDVNADGYSDVVVGTPYYDNGETDEGRAWVYHGGPAGLAAAPAWTAEGDQYYVYFGTSVGTAGDVNGDGYSDVIVGAPEYSNGQSDEGRSFVYHGNEGGGLDVLPRQYRTDLVTPVVPALKTRSQSQAGLGLLARTFFGRNDLDVQFEVKPLGTPFDGTGLVTTGWADPGTTGATVGEVIGGLNDRTMYRWRARVGYRLSGGAPQPHGRWIYQPYDGGSGEVDFQVSDDDLPMPVPPALSIRRFSGSCRLWWYTVAGATSYDLYRGTSAFFAPGTPWQIVTAPDTSYDFTAGVGDPDTNYYFLGRSVGAWGESGDSDKVGECDFGTGTAAAPKRESTSAR